VVQMSGNRYIGVFLYRDVHNRGKVTIAGIFAGALRYLKNHPV
jgi:hypothetical protein